MAAGGAPPADPFFKPAEKSLQPPTGEGDYISFPLAGGNVLEIRLKKRASPKDFERIKAIVELSESSLVEEED